MNIFEVEFGGLLEWRLEKEDPPSFPLHSLPGWTLLNPLLYPDLGISMETSYPFGTYALVKQSVLLKTGALLFQCPDSITELSDAFMTLTLRYLPDFLVALRLASKQVAMARVHPGGGRFVPERTPLPDLHFPEPQIDQQFSVQNYRLTTAITRRHVEQADEMLLKRQIPASRLVLLDAVHAFIDRDDRRTILYAAMAIEILAETKLGPLKGKGRIGESTIEKRLHRQALQVLGRSLQHENPDLYRHVEKLYRTRNALVHVGNVPSDGDYLQVTGDEGHDALFALHYATHVFRWFGVVDHFLPERGVEIAQLPVGGLHPLLDEAFPKPLPRLSI